MGGRETPATAKIRAELPLRGCPHHPVFAVPLRCAALRCAALRCAALRCAALRCGCLLFGRPGGAHPADRPPASIR